MGNCTCTTTQTPASCETNLAFSVVASYMFSLCLCTTRTHMNAELTQKVRAHECTTRTEIEFIRRSRDNSCICMYPPYASKWVQCMVYDEGGVCLGIWIVSLWQANNASGSSHASHLGGLICGVFPAFLILPNCKREAWEASLPFIAFFVGLITFVVFPMFVYFVVIPNLKEC